MPLLRDVPPTLSQPLDPLLLLPRPGVFLVVGCAVDDGLEAPKAGYSLALVQSVLLLEVGCGDDGAVDEGEVVRELVTEVGEVGVVAYGGGGV